MIDSTQLEELVSQALERTAFVFAEHTEHDLVKSQATRYAMIAYEGDARGEVHLAASDGFALELASSLLGEEPEDLDIDTEGLEALSELANIIGGSVVLALGGDTKPITLGLPNITQACAAPGFAIYCVVESMGEPLCVTWMPAANAA